MAVRQRGNGFQVDVSYTLHGKAKRYRKDFASKLEAEQDELRARGCILRGESPETASADDGSITTMQALFDAVWEREWKNQKAARTHQINGQGVVDLIGPDKHPASITTRTVDALVSAWEKLGNSGGTINRKLSSLSVMLNFAKSRGSIQVIPDLTRRKESEHRVRWFDEKEEAKILNHFEHFGRPEMVDYITVLIDSGMRADEALQIRWVDAVDKQFRLHGDATKNGKGRVIPQTARVQKILARRSRECPKDAARVFYDIETYSHVRHCWDFMREKIGYENDPQFVVHACRHTFCSRLVQRGVPILTVMQLAGHSSVSVTQRYAHLHAGNLTEAMAVLEPGGAKPVVQDQPRLRIAQ